MNLPALLFLAASPVLAVMAFTLAVIIFLHLCRFAAYIIAQAGLWQLRAVSLKPGKPWIGPYRLSVYRIRLGCWLCAQSVRFNSIGSRAALWGAGVLERLAGQLAGH